MLADYIHFLLFILFLDILLFSIKQFLVDAQVI